VGLVSLLSGVSSFRHFVQSCYLGPLNCWVEVLSFALEGHGFRAALDDKAARRCAKTLGTQSLGTGGMLVLAKRRGLIESVAAELDNLRRLGLWLVDELVDLFLKEAGEK
jgi:predicted nucleic acid-binding protein